MVKLPDLFKDGSRKKSNKLKIIAVVLILAVITGIGFLLTQSSGGQFEGKLKLKMAPESKKSIQTVKDSSKKISTNQNQFCTYAYDSSLGATFANCNTVNNGRVQIDFCYGTGCFTTGGVSYSCGDFTALRCPEAEVQTARNM